MNMNKRYGRLKVGEAKRPGNNNTFGIVGEPATNIYFYWKMSKSFEIYAR